MWMLNQNLIEQLSRAFSSALCWQTLSVRAPHPRPGEGRVTHLLELNLASITCTLSPLQAELFAMATAHPGPCRARGHCSRRGCGQRAALSSLLQVATPRVKQGTLWAVWKSNKPSWERQEAARDGSRAWIELQYLGRGPARGEGQFIDPGTLSMELCFQFLTSVCTSLECDRISNQEPGEAPHAECAYKDFILHRGKSNFLEANLIVVNTGRKLALTF